MSEITTKSLIKQMEEDLFIEGHQNDAFDGEQFDIILHALKLQELVKESTKVGTPPLIAGYLLKLVEESEK